MAIAGFSTYLEFSSYFPNRSGAEVVYLEQAYPRPKHLFPVAFAVQSVILSFSASNAIGECAAHSALVASWLVYFAVLEPRANCRGSPVSVLVAHRGKGTYGLGDEGRGCGSLHVRRYL